MKQVCTLAEMCGWQWVHFRPAKTSHGWRTPVSGPLGEGWPDLVLVRVRDKRILFVELKARGHGMVGVPLDQIEVMNVLHDAGAMAYIWRPEDWPLIELTLR